MILEIAVGSVVMYAVCYYAAGGSFFASISEGGDDA